MHHAVHPSIYRIAHSPVERSWNVALLRDPVDSLFQWDGTQLSHPDHGVVLSFASPPQIEPVTLAELPHLQHRPGDQLPEGPARQRVRLCFSKPPEDAIYALGQRTCGLRRDPGTHANWTVDPPWGHHRGMASLYQAHPYFLQHRPGRAIGVFLNSTYYSQFKLEADHVEIETLGGSYDLYITVARTPAESVELLTRLTGRPAMPPDWALGYHQSRWGYTSQDEILQLADEFQQRRIPLDVIHLDIDYMDNYRSFTFHPERFPDPKALAAELQQRNIRLVTIIDPGIRFDLDGAYSVARDGCQRGHFLKNPDGSPFSGYCWPDAALFTDYTSAEARQWWGEQQQFLFENGISGIWIDMNEPAIFSAPFSSGFSQQHPMPLALQHSEGATHAEVHNLYGHLMAKATSEGGAAWVLTRSAFVGTQRYAASWMGDNTSWWEHLQLSLPQLMSMGLSGAPFVGVDIGGFFGDCEGELLARWMEVGVFYPFMRNHSAMGTRPQEPWQFGPEIEAHVRKQIRLRHRLLPYLKHLAEEAHRHGAPILRPLFYDFPDDLESALHDDQAMFGPALMIAPIMRKGHRRRMVYFPPGAWTEVWTARAFDGPSHQVVDGPLGSMPIFARAGHDHAQVLPEVPWPQEL